MRRREKYKKLFTFCMTSLIILALAAVFGKAWYGYYRNQTFKPFWNKGNYAFIALYALINVLFSNVFGGLKVGYWRKLDVVYSLTLSSICTNIVAYLQITMINRWYLNPIPMIKVMFVDIGLILIWTFLSHDLYYHIYGTRNLLVIYGDRTPDDLILKMGTRKEKYHIAAKVNVEEGEEKIYDMMPQYGGVVIWDLPAQIRNQYLKYCYDHSIRCYITPKISDIILTGADRIHLFDTPLLLTRNIGLTIEQKFIKRFIDIFVSGVGILISSPIMLICAAAVKLYDRGPVFYRQERLTLDGKKFSIFKFRSMCVDSERNGARLASKNDSRITPVGKVLRNLHFDELPQLFNVFIGDMSMVGPRPEREIIMKEYEEEIPEFHYRLKVKAGLTGYAQVYGKYNTTPYDKLKLDLFYIENYSVLLDIKMILMTVKIFFQKEVSEGVDDNQINALKK